MPEFLKNTTENQSGPGAGLDLEAATARQSQTLTRASLLSGETLTLASHGRGEIYKPERGGLAANKEETNS